MRAVNLMPGDSGRGRYARSGGSPNGAYFVLGALAALVVFVSLFTVASRQIASGTAKLDEANAEAQAAEQQVQASTPYKDFAALARTRKATVVSLSATRFDWAHGLQEVARVVPDNVWLTAINGSSGASSASPGPTTSAAPVPQFEMKGCARGQATVARLVAGLRAVDGVRSAELKTSEKPDANGTDAGGGEDCPANKASDPTFAIVIKFGAPGQARAALDPTGQIAPAEPSAPATSIGSAAPAAAAPPKAPAAPKAAAPR